MLVTIIVPSMGTKSSESLLTAKSANDSKYNRMPVFGKLARASRLKRRATNNNKRNASNPNLTFTDYVVNEYDINNNDINNNKVIIA